MSDAEKGLREFIVARTNTPGMRDTMLDALSAALAAARAEGYARARDQAVAIAKREVERANPSGHCGMERLHRQIGADTAAIIVCDILDMKDETP